MMFLRLHRRGVVLLFTISILAILVILATTFASISRMERNVSRNYVDRVRSKFLAQSGIERAAQEVRSGLLSGSVAPVNASASEDVNKPWIYGRPASSGAVFYEPSIPLERAIFCSFSWDTLTNRNRTVKLLDRQNLKVGNPLELPYGNDDFGVSGFLAGTYTSTGDFYSVKIVDCPSKVYINGPDSNDDNPNPSTAAVVTRLQDNVVNLLNSLSVILRAEKGLAFNDLGTRISNLRVSTGRGFLRLEEIIPALGSTSAQQQAALNILRPYVTTSGWYDSGTLAPDSLEHGGPGRSSADPNLIYNPTWRSGRVVEAPSRGGTRVAERTIPDGPNLHFACPTTSGSDRHVSNIPQRWMQGSNPGAAQTSPPGAPPTMDCRTPRVPVNINTASREVIQAVMSDIRGGYLSRVSGPTTYLGNGYDASNTVAITPGTGQLANRIALAIVARRNELANNINRRYGFASWYDFTSFIDAIDNTAALNALTPPSSVARVFLDSNPVRAQAMKDTIKANANPNGHLNKFNPDRAFGSRFGDTDKADLTRWTTEFCFNSNGYFELESIGRVCDRPNGAGQMPVVAETVIRSAVKLYEVYRISTQKDFVANQIGGSGAANLLVPYPEHMTDIGGSTTSSRTAAAADYDGYLMLDTTDTAQGQGGLGFFANYATDLGADAAGPAEQGTSLVWNGTGGNPSAGGQSELLTDGFFNTRTRRYANYTNLGSPSAWGAPNIGPIDEYIRNERASVKISMSQGSLDMWVKPIWSATGYAPSSNDPPPDFNPSRYNAADNPNAVSRRTLFSVGEGTTAANYPAPLNSSSLEVSDNRIYLYAAYDTGGVFLMGSEVTRLCNVPNGLVAQWYKTLDWGAHNVLDRSSQSRNHPNWRQLRGDADSDWEPRWSAGTNTWNPRKWRYAGGWHHVRMCWRDQTSWMFVDGQPGGEDPITGFRSPNTPANIDAYWSLFVGSNRFKHDDTNGYPCNADATIDDVKVYTTCISTSPFAPPQRYVGSGTYEGKIGPRQNVLDTNVLPLGGGGRVAAVSWTVWYPRFSGTPTSCTVEIGKAGGPYTAVSPNMSGGQAPELAGRGTPVPNLTLQAGVQLAYRVTMTSGLPDQIASPIFDDISVMVTSSAPQFLYYGIE